MKKFRTGRRIILLASRDDLVKFAKGKQAISDFLDLLRGCLIEYNTLMTSPEKSNVWKAKASNR